MVSPVANYKSAPFNGPFSIGALLIDTISAANYEGLWVDSEWAKNLSLDVEGSAGTFSIQLYGTNFDSVAEQNEYVITIAGSSTLNDVVSLKFSNPNIPAGSESVSYTVQTSDTATIIAAALVAAINADAVLQGLGFFASNAAGVITITFPSIPANKNPMPTTLNIGNFTVLSSSVTGGASETVAIATGTNGNTLGSAITAKAITELTILPRYIKARLTALSGGGSISAALNGSA